MYKRLFATTALRLAVAYVVMTVSFALLMIGMAHIPHQAIRANVLASEQQLIHEGNYPSMGVWLLMLDNFTDALMLDVTASVDENAPMASALVCPFYFVDGHPAEDAVRVCKEERQGLIYTNYGRYWLGHQVVLRPLLTVVDYSVIRILNYIALTALFLWTAVLLWRRVSRWTAVAFAASLLMVAFPIVPLSMQFSMCFYVALAAMVAILSVPALSASLPVTVCTFFVIGGLTSFFDFLTTPQLTLGLPLTACLLVSSRRDKMRLVVVLSVAWTLGYGGLWATKWILATLLTDYNFFAEGLSNVQRRVDGSISGLSLLAVVKYYFITVSPLALVAAAAAVARRRCGKEFFMHHAWLLLVALIAPVWFVVIRNHTIEHSWFVWRALAVTFFALLLWLRLMMSHSKSQQLCPNE